MSTTTTQPGIGAASATPDTAPAPAPDTTPGPATPPEQAAKPHINSPGTIVRIRGEEWLVEASSEDRGMVWLTVRGLRGLVRDQAAMFSPDLDTIEEVSPKDTLLVADDSPHYRRARLWLEATLRKTPEPVRSQNITVANKGLVNALDYQLEAVRKALSDENPRTRILLADAVGLGKTIEIGMILSELIARGKGERVLIVTPRHVLEQTQLELWSRFGLPFVRLDSVGIQRVRQQIPATRNPFTYFPRAIVSIDTLKSDQYVHQIGSQRWDAVVIDESHNLSNSETLNNRLARTLAVNTDALILASATPHNGKAESFAELIHLLDPTAITPDGQLKRDEVERLVIRRHRHSPSVKAEVGSDWAERKEPIQLPVTPNPQENALATELADTWLHPKGGKSPVTDARGAEALFPWTLAKAFLSSPAALLETVQSRKRRAQEAGKLGPEEAAALDRLEVLAEDALEPDSGKFQGLVNYLKHIGVGKGSATRAVVFAERIATLDYLAERLPKALGMPKDAFATMHGSLDDTKQQEIVDEFSRASSLIRVLITSDVASEGVNLHMQSHNLIHYDLPWSLIRIEQRNGRIDRYGQKHPPQIAMLVLQPSHEEFSGDIKVLTALMKREHEAHRTLGDSASLMGKYSVSAEEEEIKWVLAKRKTLEEVVLQPDAVATEGDEVAAIWADFFGTPTEPVEELVPQSEPEPEPTSLGLFEDEAAFLSEAIAEIASQPHSDSVDFQHFEVEGIAKLIPPADLVKRLAVLPQTYLKERKVTEEIVLATTKARGEDRRDAARKGKSGSSWPDASYLTPLHPVSDWATDRSLAALGRGKIFAVRGDVATPTVLVLATLANSTGAVTTAAWLGVHFPDPANPTLAFITPYDSAADAITSLGWDAERTNPGAVANVDELQGLIPTAVDESERYASEIFKYAQAAATEEYEHWQKRSEAWQEEAASLTQREKVRARRRAVEEQNAYLQGLAPSRLLVRPILLAVPANWPVGSKNATDSENNGRG